MRRTITVATLVAGVAVVAGGITAYATSDDGPSKDGTGAFAPRVAQVDPELASAFKVLSDGRPSESAVTIDKEVTPKGMNAALARGVKTAIGEVSVIPGEGNLCVQILDTSDSGLATKNVSCNPTDIAVKNGVVILIRSSRTDRITRAAGVVPDGVAAVDLRDGDAEVATAAVTDNVWAIEGTSADGMQFIGGNGRAIGDVHQFGVN